jgi:DNA-binding transcriptional ArsR family regulator
MMGKPDAGELQRFKADFFRALAHPLRIRILETLRAGEQSVSELQTQLGVDQPALSQQLGVLRGKNILGTRKEGTTVRYFLRDPLVHELLAVARRIFDRHLVGTQSLLRELRAESRSRR